ncbi:hypothetical protein OTSUT76_1958 [Orientia tsutsugamushi str. UT76]|uniref:Uncharacterized protein n=1 Tax=Orientia tsutsugamushi TaxID=784 RepID=A0A2U3QNX8_ORITS|nr:hypothetical protein OTSUT76_1958 [Orientia tsutsugamushi str. UT76]SPR02657.1 Uncharacterised protein [Orientia tsutsugamushi]
MSVIVFKFTQAALNKIKVPTKLEIQKKGTYFL